MNSGKYLIVGQGLAGTCLATFLEKLGADFLIIDSLSKPKASHTAAGLWNPIVLRRFLKAWLADETLAFSVPFYKEEAKALHANFVHELAMFKIFSNQNEAQECQNRIAQQGLNHLAEVVNQADINLGVKQPYGCLKVHKTGYLEVANYLNLKRNQWLDSGRLQEKDFNYQDITFKNSSVYYQEENYKAIIFCEGIGASQNPFVKLPFKNTKGEVLKVSLPFELHDIVSKNVFVLPLYNGQYKIGATYDWNNLDEIPTENGKQELLSKLDLILPEIKVQIHEHSAGIRPTMPDRRPICGTIKTYPGLYIFNGLGSRGVLLAPYLAHRLALCLCQGVYEIPEECAISRFS